jgi:hypothetical protein
LAFSSIISYLKSEGRQQYKGKQIKMSLKELSALKGCQSLSELIFFLFSKYIYSNLNKSSHWKRKNSGV